jgi:hypothetical protein
MRSFVAIPLTPADIDAAFPLIQNLWPDHSLSEWRVFANLRLGPGEGGILGLRGESGHLNGLAIWRRASDLDHGLVLIVDYLVALDLMEPEKVAGALVDGLESLAKGCGARAVQVTLPPTETILLRPFLAAGHHLEGVKLCKAISQAPVTR